jgi:8-oxo-dGTP pyrophosphatase MutT (NUDIX family)
LTDRHYPFTGPLAPADASAVILTDDEQRYVMQLRDDRPGIFYPNRWGLFGGALEPGETSVQAAERELFEEIGIDTAGKLEEFCELILDFRPFGYGPVKRTIFEMRQPVQLSAVRLGEGQRCAAVDIVAEMRGGRIVPYDEFALWMHLNRPASGTAAS